MMGEPVEQCGGHLSIAEDGGPFAECQVGGDDHAGALVELRDQMEEQLPAGLSEGEITEFVKHDEVEPRQMVGNAALPAGAGLGLEPVDQIDDIVEAAASAVSDQRPGNGDSQMGFAGAADQDDIALIGNEGSASEIADQAIVDRRAGEVEVVDVLGQRQLGDGELVFDGAGLFLRCLCLPPAGTPGSLPVNASSRIADDLRSLETMPPAAPTPIT